MCIISLVSKIPKYLLWPLPDSSSAIASLGESSIPLTLTSFPAFIVTCAHFFIPNSIAIPFEKILTVFVSLSDSFHYFHEASNYPWKESDWSFCAALFQVGILHLLFEGYDLRELNQWETIKEIEYPLEGFLFRIFTLASSSCHYFKIGCQLSILLDKKWDMLSATPHIPMDFLIHEWGTIS